MLPGEEGPDSRLALPTQDWLQTVRPPGTRPARGPDWWQRRGGAPVSGGGSARQSWLTTPPRATASSTCGHLLDATPLAHPSHVILLTPHLWVGADLRQEPGRGSQGRTEPRPGPLVSMETHPGLCAPPEPWLPQPVTASTWSPALLRQMLEGDQRRARPLQITQQVGGRGVHQGPAPSDPHLSTETGLVRAPVAGWPRQPRPKLSCKNLAWEHRADQAGQCPLGALGTGTPLAPCQTT